MNTGKPLIGILTNLLAVETGIFSGTERIYVNRDYVDSVLRAGATPLLLPIIADQEAIFQQMSACDALIFSGGQDVHPHHYNEEPSHFLEAVCYERDLYEMAALRFAIQQKMAIFGICRGLQLMNVAFGGTLYQDIAKQIPEGSLAHSQKARKDEITHAVDLADESWLQRIFKKKTLMTNSFHHQAIKDLAPEFRAIAWAKDGIIEAIEKNDDSCVVAVQWHPEMMTEKHSDMHLLFCAFVDEVKQRNKKATKKVEVYAHE